MKKSIIIKLIKFQQHFILISEIHEMKVVIHDHNQVCIWRTTQKGNQNSIKSMHTLTTYTHYQILKNNFSKLFDQTIQYLIQMIQIEAFALNLKRELRFIQFIYKIMKHIINMILYKHSTSKISIEIYNIN